jgi:indole-3-glycerol phosphate synthase
MQAPTLDEMVAAARDRAAALRPQAAELERRAADRPVPPSWAARLVGDEVAVIAEVKRRSPSAGDIHPDLDPAVLARAYAAGGAAALSVLTDAPYFGGSLDDLARARLAVTLPVLRKDFIVDELQLLEARAAGASAVLLIARALVQARLEALASAARDLGLETLIEAHTPVEVSRAVAAGGTAVGVNSRDLDTFVVDHAVPLALIAQVPASIPAVAESGVRDRADVTRFAVAGADAVLVGTSLAAAPDPAAAVRALVGVARRGRGRR